jgi:hypothetical protein
VQEMIRVVDNRHRGNWHLEPYTIRTLIHLLIRDRPPHRGSDSLATSGCGLG